MTHAVILLVLLSVELIHSTPYMNGRATTRGVSKRMRFLWIAWSCIRRVCKHGQEELHCPPMVVSTQPLPCHALSSGNSCRFTTTYLISTHPMNSQRTQKRRISCQVSMVPPSPPSCQTLPCYTPHLLRWATATYLMSTHPMDPHRIQKRRTNRWRERWKEGRLGMEGDEMEGGGEKRMDILTW